MLDEDVEALRLENERLRAVAESKLNLLEEMEAAMAHIDEDQGTLDDEPEAECEDSAGAEAEAEAEGTAGPWLATESVAGALEVAEELAYEPEDDAVAALESELEGETAEEVPELPPVAAEGPSPEALAGERPGWMYFLAPENPAAGESAQVFFNRKQCDALRDRPQIVITYGFNNWEHEGGSAVHLHPSEVDATDSMDWWSAALEIPEDAFELNFVFSDGEQCYENNNGENFVHSMRGYSRAQWEEAAGAREAARLAEEEAEREEEAARAEALRLAELERLDLEEAQKIVHGARDPATQEGAVEAFEREGATVWRPGPGGLVAGEAGTIVYDPSGGVLENSNAVRLHFGHNGWQDASDMDMVRVSGGWEAEIAVPKTTVALNMVFSDGGSCYDNNGQADYKAKVSLPTGVDEEAWWADVEAAVRAEIKASRVQQEEEEAAKEAIRTARREEAKEYSRIVRRRQKHHLFYTEPAEPVAGREVTVFYNHKNTNLAHCSQVFLHGGFNRWKHTMALEGVKMAPVVVDREERFKATVKVPKDTYMMDFVMSDSPGKEGTYDSNHGLDYHVPVSGGAASPPLHVTHIAVEMAPIAKVGGLGDVVTALARCVQDLGHHTEIILPRYDFLLGSPLLHGTTYEGEFDWGGCKNFVTTCMVEGVRVFFIEPSNGFFKVDSVYGRYDDPVRFDFFCKASLEFLLQTGRQPDILHCHDWSSAEVAKAYWQDYHSYGLAKPKVVFTIHNMNYGAAKIAEAAMYCQKFTTVSPSYADEISEHPSIAPNHVKFVGIRNGIDNDIWDPSNDQFLPTGYTAETVVEGKAAARQALRERLGLRTDRDAPVIGVVSRLTPQKGIHLIKHAAWRTRDRGAQFVLLGSAPDPKIQADFNSLAGSMQGDMAAFVFTYDEPLSHLIYAGCDMILVPSMFEPCGLTQMIAMRYGAVPVVRSTGGLHDTVFDVDHDQGRGAWEVHGVAEEDAEQGLVGTNGFAFEGSDEGALDYALNRAIDAYYNDVEWFHTLQQRVASQNWSWDGPAEAYMELYYSAIGQ